MFGFIKNLFSEKSKNIYCLPVKRETQIKNVLYDWPSHSGKFSGAVDLAVELGTVLIAPLDGKVIEVVDEFDKYGPSGEFAKYLNYITFAHENNEYSQLAHVAKGSVKVKVGQLVKKGEEIAVTGLNGWMEEPYLQHVHMFVYKVFPEGGFQGVKIRFSEKPRESA